MTEIKTFVENKFKNRLDKQRFEKYLIMGEYLDRAGTEALSWDANEAFNDFSLNGSKLLGNISLDILPTYEDWKEFITNNIISKLLTELVLQNQSVTLRKLINNLNSQKNLTQSEIKAISTLADMITNEDGVYDTMTYVQYTCPIRFDETDLDEVVYEFIEEEI